MRAGVTWEPHSRWRLIPWIWLVQKRPWVLVRYAYCLLSPKETSFPQFSYPRKPGSLPLMAISLPPPFLRKRVNRHLLSIYWCFLVSMCFTPLKQLSLKSLMTSLRPNQTDDFHSCSKNKWKLHKFKSLLLHLLAVWPWEFTSSFYSSGS